jgi:hypothetical protein
MRVLCSAIDGEDIEGEIIGGEDFKLVDGSVDLESAFTVRCDDGTCHRVHGWLVDVSVIPGSELLPRTIN